MARNAPSPRIIGRVLRRQGASLSVYLPTGLSLRSQAGGTVRADVSLYASWRFHTKRSGTGRSNTLNIGFEQ